MGACDIKYELITPDGWTLDFLGPAVSPGSSDSLMAHEGFGLPPVEHVTQEVYQMPGALMQDTVVKPRVVTITTTTHGLTPKAMHTARAKLMDAMRWNRGTRAQPSILRYTVNGTPRDLYVHYAGDVRRSVGRYGQMEIIGFRLAAYDPMFYDPVTRELVLDWDDSSVVRYFASRVNGLWENDIPQPAAVAAGVGGPAVWDVAVDPNTGDVYVGGDFTDWDNIPNADYLVRHDVSAGVWQAVGDNGAGGPALNERVLGLTFGPDGTLYVGGYFTNAGGVGAAADYLAQVDVETDTWSDVHGGDGAGTTTVVYDIAIGHAGEIFVAGNFTNWQGLGAAGNHIVEYDPSVPAWVGTLGGASHWVRTITIALDGSLIAGGLFTTIGAIGVHYVAAWDGTIWDYMNDGFNSTVYDVECGPDGTIYATGAFQNIFTGVVQANGIASWNGTIWSPCGSGLGPWVATGWDMAIDDQGTVWLVGGFSTAGGLATAGGIARWNGHAWAHVDIDFPAGTICHCIETWSAGVYVGFDSTGTAYYAGANTSTNLGNMATYPVIEIKNYGLLQTIRNETMGYELLFNLQILDGEIVTIDLSPGLKTIESNWRGNRLGDSLPDSDLGTFVLESAPRAAYGGVDGANLISAFMTDAAPRESGDNNNQLSGWHLITGISQDNTDLGTLYVDIVADGGGFYHVDLYMDMAKANLMGHTGTYNGAGTEPIVEDNDSGLGGTMIIDAVVGADTDIEVIFTIVTMFWQDRWLDADNAVS